MSIEHKTSEKVSGRVTNDNIIEREGSRIVGVKGPTFIQQFFVPICQNRRDIATMLAGQLAKPLAENAISMQRVFELADEWVMEERRSAKRVMPRYFDLYMETDQTVEDALVELEQDFHLGDPQ